MLVFRRCGSSAREGCGEGAQGWDAKTHHPEALECSHVLLAKPRKIEVRVVAAVAKSHEKGERRCPV